jgi:hypothetical protein
MTLHEYTLLYSNSLAINLGPGHETPMSSEYGYILSGYQPAPVRKSWISAGPREVLCQAQNSYDNPHFPNYWPADDNPSDHSSSAGISLQSQYAAVLQCNPSLLLPVRHAAENL